MQLRHRRQDCDKLGKSFPAILTGPHTLVTLKGALDRWVTQILQSRYA